MGPWVAPRGPRGITRATNADAPDDESGDDESPDADACGFSSAGRDVELLANARVRRGALRDALQWSLGRVRATPWNEPRREYRARSMRARRARRDVGREEMSRKHVSSSRLRSLLSTNVGNRPRPLRHRACHVATRVGLCDASSCVGPETRGAAESRVRPRPSARLAPHARRDPRVLLRSQKQCRSHRTSLRVFITTRRAPRRVQRVACPCAY